MAPVKFEKRIPLGRMDWTFWPVEEWPKKSAGGIATYVRENVNKL